MDDRGRLAQPLKRPGSAAAKPRRAGRRAVAERPAWWQAAVDVAARLGRKIENQAIRLVRWVPRRAGAIASAALVLASLGYGVYKGEHGAAITGYLGDLRDDAANAAGFRIAGLSITGNTQLSEADVLAAAGITARTSLLFLDVEATRRKLEATPWIAQASVRKFYPGSLTIAIEERRAFALWQKDGKLSIIAEDGTVLGPLGERRLTTLPLVVGPGAGARAREFVAILDRYPAIRDQLRASVLVAERRWNLKLKNGLDIRLPETEIERALDNLVALDREKKILSRDLTAIDMRLPDRLTVRLSDEAAAAREQALKEKKKRKGGDA
jgi:cell division protein FtsQ